MKYLIIFIIVSIVGTAGLMPEATKEVPIEYIEFTDPLHININI